MSFDWFTFIAQLVNFGLLVFLLRLFLYKPVLGVMEKRQERLAKAWEEARSAEASAREEAARLSAERSGLEQTRRQRLEQVELEAQEVRKRRLEEAAEAAEQELQRQAARLAQERAELISALTRKGSEVLVAELAGALSDLADAQLDEQAARTFAYQLEELAEEQKYKLRAAAEGARPVVSTAFEPTAEVKALLVGAVAGACGSSQPPAFEVDPDLLFGAALTVGAVRVEASGRKRAAAVESAFSSVLAR